MTLATKFFLGLAALLICGTSAAAPTVSLDVGTIYSELSEDGPGSYASLTLSHGDLDVGVGLRDYNHITYPIANPSARVRHDFEVANIGAAINFNLSPRWQFRPEVGAEYSLTDINNIVTSENDWGYYGQLGLTYLVAPRLKLTTFAGYSSGPSHIPEHWYGGVGLQFWFMGSAKRPPVKKAEGTLTALVAPRQASPSSRQLASTRVEPVTAPVQSPEGEAVAQTSSAKAPSRARPVRAAQPLPFNYAVQIGAFHQPQNASRLLALANRLKQPLYTDKNGSDSGYFRLYIMPSSNQAEVRKALIQVQQWFPDAFVKRIRKPIRPYKSARMPR